MSCVLFLADLQRSVFHLTTINCCGEECVEEITRILDDGLINGRYDLRIYDAV